MFKENQQIGLYTLIRKLGRGGFGEVWLAEKRAKFVTTKVAIKLPLDEQVDHEAIKQEASLWEQASGHPNVLPIIDADECDGQIIIVSEYASGGTLADKLKLEGKLPVKIAVELTIGILNGLHYLHSKNIIHRDIKPANILLQGDTPRLADFGISRAINTSTTSSVIIGTGAYMSPESFDGKRNVKTDVWSVGVVLYQMLKGELPFPQQHPSEKMFAILTKEFEPLSDDIPLMLREIIRKSLSKEPESRYQSALQMREDLQSFISGVSQLMFSRKGLNLVSTSEQKEETETKVGKSISVSDKNLPEKTIGANASIDSDNSFHISPQKFSGYKMTERGIREETGLSTEIPVRGNRESDTYWNTRVLTHSILGKHYRTPQANLNILVKFLNSVLSEDKQILRFSFVAPTTSNLRFFTRNKEIFFNAHESINKKDFLNKFDLNNDIQLNSFPKKDKSAEPSKTILNISHPDNFTHFIPFRENNFWGFCDFKKNILIKPKYENVSLFNEGLAKVALKEKWGTMAVGFIDKKGQEVIPLRFQAAYSFSNDLAGIKKGSKFGFIDKEGKEIIPAKFDRISSFNEGRAAASINNKWGFISNSGEEITPFRYDYAPLNWNGLVGLELAGFNFTDGRAAVKLVNKCGFIDRTGHIVIPIEYQSCAPFQEGLAKVSLNGKYGFINKFGQTLIRLQFEDAASFSEGFAAVKFNGKWGFIASNGREVILNRYKQVSNFQEGLASVKLNESWGFINNNGEVVVPLIYKSTTNFSEGLAGVEYVDERGFIKCGFINKTGSLIIPLKYSYVSHFINGIARVSLNKKWGYVGKDGTEYFDD